MSERRITIDVSANERRIYDRVRARFVEHGPGEGEYAVLTIEASTLEAHLDRLDLFLHSEVRIFGEFYLIPRIGLYAAVGIEAVEKVFATPSLLAQASEWVEREGRNYRFIAVGGAEEAATRAKQEAGGVLGYGVLTGSHDLVSLEEALEDKVTLHRRFLILGRQDGSRTGHDKTSCLAVIPNRPGGLNEITEILSRHGVNLCWIEPKATPIGTWDHIFFLDLEGHRCDEAVSKALEEIKSRTDWMKILGSYPSERPPGYSFG